MRNIKNNDSIKAINYIVHLIVFKSTGRAQYWDTACQFHRVLGRAEKACVSRLLHIPSLVAVRLSVGYDTTWPAIGWHHPLWLLGLHKVEDCFSRNGLWIRETGGKFYRFSKATDNGREKPANFHITEQFCGESISHYLIPHTTGQLRWVLMRSLMSAWANCWNKQSNCQRFDTPWHLCDKSVMLNSYILYGAIQV